MTPSRAHCILSRMIGNVPFRKRAHSSARTFGSTVKTYKQLLTELSPQVRRQLERVGLVHLPMGRGGGKGSHAPKPFLYVFSEAAPRNRRRNLSVNLACSGLSGSAISGDAAGPQVTTAGWSIGANETVCRAQLYPFSSTIERQWCVLKV
jgi:hypothetical protein